MPLCKRKAQGQRPRASNKVYERLGNALSAAVVGVGVRIQSQVCQTTELRKLGRLIFLLGGGGLDFVFHKFRLKFCGWNTPVPFPRQALVLRFFQPGRTLGHCPPDGQHRISEVRVGYAPTSGV